MRTLTLTLAACLLVLAAAGAAFAQGDPGDGSVALLMNGVNPRDVAQNEVYLAAGSNASIAVEDGGQQTAFVLLGDQDLTFGANPVPWGGSIDLASPSILIDGLGAGIGAAFGRTDFSISFPIPLGLAGSRGPAFQTLYLDANQIPFPFDQTAAGVFVINDAGTFATPSFADLGTQLTIELSSLTTQDPADLCVQLKAPNGDFGGVAVDGIMGTQINATVRNLPAGLAAAQLIVAEGDGAFLNPAPNPIYTVVEAQAWRSTPMTNPTTIQTLAVAPGGGGGGTVCPNCTLYEATANTAGTFIEISIPIDPLDLCQAGTALKLWVHGASTDGFTTSVITGSDFHAEICEDVAGDLLTCLGHVAQTFTDAFLALDTPVNIGIPVFGLVGKTVVRVLPPPGDTWLPSARAKIWVCNP